MKPTIYQSFLSFLRCAWEREMTRYAIDKDVRSGCTARERKVRARFWSIAVKKAQRGDAVVVRKEGDIPAVMDTTNIPNLGGVGIPLQDVSNALAAARCTGGDYDAGPPKGS